MASLKGGGKPKKNKKIKSPRKRSLLSFFFLNPIETLRIKLRDLQEEEEEEKEEEEGGGGG